jgi:hypothetical protein
LSRLVVCSEDDARQAFESVVAAEEDSAEQRLVGARLAINEISNLVRSHNLALDVRVIEKSRPLRNIVRARLRSFDMRCGHGAWR